MTARRKKRNTRSRTKKRFDFKKLVIFLIALVVIFSVFFFFYIRYTSKFFSTSDKLHLAINADESIIVSVFDPAGGEITNIYIPKNTQVESARNLGTLPIGSIWELGKNEGLQGKLLAETLTRYMKFPVTAWADSPAQGFSRKQGTLFRASLFPYASSLGVGDKIRLGLFTFGVNTAKTNNIYLEKTAHLQEKKLADASKGYVLSAHPKKEILSLFADSHISKSQARVVIKNKSDSLTVPKKMGEVLEVLGMKVANIEEKESQNSGCKILASDEKIAATITKYFDCEYEISEGVVFSAEIEIGEKFVKKY